MLAAGDVIQLGPLHQPGAVEHHQVILAADVAQGIGEPEAAEVAPEGGLAAALRPHQYASGIVLAAGLKDPPDGRDEGGL